MNMSQAAISSANLPSVSTMNSAQQTKQDSNYKNGKNWQSNTAKTLNKNSNSMYAVCGAVILLLIICCSWGSCQDILFGASKGNQSNYGDLPPAAFNPYARLNHLNDSINQSNQ